MELLSLGGFAKAVALAFGAAAIAPKPETGRTADLGAVIDHGAPRAALPFARSPEAVEIVATPRRTRIALEQTPPLPLAPKVAAKRFVAWMQAQGWHGERAWAGKNGVWDYYLLHCACEDLAPLPDNLFAAQLARIVPKRIVRARIEGMPGRPTFYAIPPAPEPRAPVQAQQKTGSGRQRSAA